MIKELLRAIDRKVGYLPIRNKLLIAFILLTGVPVTLAGLAANALAIGALEGLALQRLNAEVETLQVTLETNLRAVEADVAMLAASPDLVAAVDQPPSSAQADRLRRGWEAFLRVKPLYYRLRLFNRWAEEVVRLGRMPGDDRPHPLPQPFHMFRLGSALPGATTITPVELAGETTGAVVSAVSFSQAVHDDTGDLMGAVVAEVVATDIFDLQISTGPFNDSVLILDREGNYVYNSEYRNSWNAFLAERSSSSLWDRYPRQIAEQVLSGAAGSARVPEGDFLAFRPVLHESGSFHVLVREVPAEVVLAAVGRSRVVFGLLLLASLGLAAILGVVAASHFTEPTRLLLEGAQRLAQGDYAHRIALGTFDEIDDLADAFNAMGEAIEQRESRIRSHNNELEALVQQRTAELLRAERLAAAGELVAGIAHEIGTPLNVISGYAEHLLMQSRLEPQAEARDDGHAGPKVDSGPEEEARPDAEPNLQLIIGETQRIAELVRDLQDFTRPRAPVRESIDVGSIVGEAICLLRGSSQEAGVSIELEVEPDTTFAWGDPVEIKQAILNLLLNAIHASDTEGTVRIEVRTAADQVQVLVIDDGAGIAPEALERIFEPFFTTKRPGEGTGLGLAIVQRIVERHNGSISARSSPGDGAAFDMRLPRVEGTHANQQS